MKYRLKQLIINKHLEGVRYVNPFSAHKLLLINLPAEDVEEFGCDALLTQFVEFEFERF